ncbi:CBS domain-containing protein [Kitasatospora sp. NPDC002227]|uniref:CBS domain-containing protein n=1 Tax=Kitasatospora sp. NPDC002227 TaxID=3154773 RepID=UPI00331BC5FB
MKHSILDGTAADTFPAAARPAGRACVRDCMGGPRVAVTPGTDFATLVAVLSASQRGVVPVVSPDGTMTGVVAVSDLLAAYADGDRAGALLARDLMTAPAVTATADMSCAEAVTLLSGNAVHHLPVVDGDGRLIGLLSAQDLLDALREDDEAIRADALALALTPGSGVVPNSLRIRCERGRVAVSGRTRTRSDAAALCLQIARIEGVTGLADGLSWDVDDTDASPVG